MKRKKIIKFLDINGESAFFDMPKPSSTYIPDWYKKTIGYVNGKKEMWGNGNIPNVTIKKCMPVYDSITAGYIITLPADVEVKLVDGVQTFISNYPEIISYHQTIQVPEYPDDNNGNEYPKWMNMWGVLTPPGWSTLFIQPLHRESVFTILPGLVDTDKFSLPVQFPFTMNDKSWEGVIPEGTPIAQLIPIKRESWVGEAGNNKDRDKNQKIFDKLFSLEVNRYKLSAWTKKEYK
jgi:hypothetical protein